MKVNRAQMEPQAVPTGPDYTDNESITVSTTALALTPAKVGEHKFAFITVEAQSVRYWVNGAVPTATVGYQLDAGDALTLDSRSQLIQFRVIRKDGADSTLRVSYGD